MSPLDTNRRLIYLLIIPLAIYLGWVLSEPQSFGTMVTVGGLFALLLVPILLRWHQPMLIFLWNATPMAFFLPGSPPMWMPIAGAAFTIILLQWIIAKKTPPLTVRSINWAIAGILVVTLVTAYVRGGIGLRSMGSDAYGGKRYVYILAAIIGYYALSMIRIPADKVGRYSSLFLLSGLTNVISNLIYIAGPAFYWLYFLFPVDTAVSQIQADVSGSGLVRLAGLSSAMMFLYYYLLARYPVREVFSVSRPWLPCLILAVVAVGMLGGFRSVFVFLLVIFAVKFVLDGLLWTRLFFALVLVGVFLGAIILPLADKLPLAMQRTISFLPFAPVDQFVRIDAWSSTDWRLQMWAVLMEDLPEYLLIGKGYVISPTDMFLVQESLARGFAQPHEASLIAGDYHSGPLSVLVNFGIPGALAWLVFCIVSLHALIRNFRYGESRWRNLNGFLLAFYSTKIVFFYIVFGDFATELYIFTGVLGMSVAINGGVRSKPPVTRPVLTIPALDVRRFENEPVLAPGSL